MAPSTAYPGLYAEVTVDGCRLTEYDDGEDARSKTKRVYIQSEEGEQFGVQYFIPPSLFMEYGIKAEVSIDGVIMRKYIHDNYVGRLHGVSRYACASSANIGDLCVGQRFRFATLDTRKFDSSIFSNQSNEIHIDDDTGTVNTAVQNQLAATGEISVSFYRITNIRVSSADKKAPTIQEYDKVPEKAMKGSAVSLKTQYDSKGFLTLSNLLTDWIDSTPSNALHQLRGSKPTMSMEIAHSLLFNSNTALQVRDTVSNKKDKA